MTNTQTIAAFFSPSQKEWTSATISIGTYNTKGYSEKVYKTKSGLMKAMILLGYSTNHPHSGETWNNHNKQYIVTFDYI
jgi:hypothetical protein